MCSMIEDVWPSGKKKKEEKNTYLSQFTSLTGISGEHTYYQKAKYLSKHKYSHRNTVRQPISVDITLLYDIVMYLYS
jgi:hypothetical protein